MQPKSIILRWTRKIAPLSITLLLLLATAIGTAAQSGRKPPKPPKSPDPLPSKQEDPPIAPPSEQKSTPKIPVKVGLSNGSVTEIIEGLKEGDKVVLQQ